MVVYSAHGTTKKTVRFLKEATPMKPDDKDTDRLEDEKLEITQRFYMGSNATSPHTMLPSINTEGFMFLKKFFRKRKQDKIAKKS
jgi:hypothetical protein